MMSGYMRWYPFAAVTGQEQAKRAICITLVNPKAGGETPLRQTISNLKYLNVRSE